MSTTKASGADDGEAGKKDRDHLLDEHEAEQLRHGALAGTRLLDGVGSVRLGKTARPSSRATSEAGGGSIITKPTSEPLGSMPAVFPRFERPLEAEPSEGGNDKPLKSLKERTKP